MNLRKPVVEMIDDEMADILREKTEIERLRIAGRMWLSARAILRGAIRTENPDWDEGQVNREIARRISIDEWAEKLGVLTEWQLVCDQLKKSGS